MADTSDSTPLTDTRGAVLVAFGLPLLTLVIHFLTNGGYGYFLETNRSGRVLFWPAP